MRLLALVAGLSCATLGASDWRRADWADMVSTQASVRCAVAAEFDGELADRVVGLPVFVRPGLGLRRFDAQTRAIYLSADARSLLASPYRHEIFEHVVPFFRSGGREWNEEHAPEWAAVAERLDRRASQCRREASR